MVAMMGSGKDVEAAGPQAPPIDASAPPAAELHSSAPTGFDVLFDTYFDRAVRLAWLLAPGDPSGAEDAAADAIARVWSKWAKGRVEEFWPYLRVAVVNQVRGRGRRFAIGQRRFATATAGAYDETRADFQMAVVDRAFLADALRALPTRQRTAVVLRYYEDLSEAESARAMGCSIGTVKSTTARGLHALRAQLGSNER
jgi:RNA polymerase sigma-70 factor (sigma-E family)